MAFNRHTLHLHLGITLFAFLPGALLSLLTGSWIVGAVTVILLDLLALTGHHWFIVTAYHVLKPFARILGDEGFAPERMVISLASLKTLSSTGGLPPERILLLLPHCLQNHDCGYRITFDPGNCRRCGRCQVGELVDLAERTGIAIAVATGGTLARRHVMEKKPLAVIAVACPRDLGQGMMDAWPVPVLGIENDRPCGDCLDTAVNVEAVERAVRELTS